MHYVLLYEAADDYVTRRAPFRGAHLAKVQEAHRRGEIVIGGPWDEPVDGAMIVFRQKAAAERFAESDPYVVNGAVRAWRVRHWNTVLGDGAILPAVGEAAVEVPGRPDASEMAPYMSQYAGLVEDGDIVRVLST